MRKWCGSIHDAERDFVWTKGVSAEGGQGVIRESLEREGGEGESPNLSKRVVGIRFALAGGRMREEAAGG